MSKENTLSVGDSIIIGGSELFLVKKVSKMRPSDKEIDILRSQYENPDVADDIFRLDVIATASNGDVTSLVFMSSDNISVKKKVSE
ncbi:hypothetical protein [Serratia fonticola]